MTDAPINEIEATAQQAKAAAEAAADRDMAAPRKGWNTLSLAIGLGVGSAAIAAALLYANAGRRKR